VLDIIFSTPEEGIEKLKSAVQIRDTMGGAMYWNICNDDCLMLAHNLVSVGADEQQIFSILN